MRGIARSLSPTLRDLRRSPISLALLVLVWVTAVVTRSWEQTPLGPGVRDLQVHLDLRQTQPVAVLTSLVVTSTAVSSIIATIALLTLGITAERRLGTWRFVVALLGSHVLGLLAAAGVATMIATSSTVWGRLLTHSAVTGPGPAVLGAFLAASASMPALLRRRLRAGTLVLVVTAVLYDGDAAGLLTLWCALAGLTLGRLLRRGEPPIGPVPQAGERRLLVAIMVAAGAMGPIIPAFSANVSGPFSSLAALLNLNAPGRTAIAAICRTDSTQACAFAQLQGQRGFGAVIMAMLPSLLLITMSIGLRRGRRAAWIASLLVAAGVALVSLTVFVFSPIMRRGPRPAVARLQISPAELIVHNALPVLVPVAIVVLLIVLRRLFHVRTARQVARRLTLRVVVTLAAGLVIYVLIGVIAPDEWRPSATFGALAHDAVLRMLPLAVIGRSLPASLPDGPIADFAFSWLAPVTWLVVIGWIIAALRTDGSAGTRDVEQVRDLLARKPGGTGGTLSWMALWAGNRHWFSADGRAAIAYRVEHGVALTVGEPIGDPDTHAAALAEFSTFCDHMGWITCFYSTSPEFAAIARSTGWHTLQVAEETRLALGEVQFKGKRFQDIRTAMNHAQRDGLRIEWTTLPQCPPRLAAQIREISQEWLAGQKLPELGFTLGGLPEMDDPAVRCQLVVDADETVHAVASWLPIHTDGVVTGWTLDVIRRRETGFRAAIDLLIARAALDLQEEGFAVLSLSGAPLARVTETEELPNQLAKVLDLLGATLEPVYGFRSLLRFKSKFDPQFRPMYLVHADPANLPTIGQAVTSAYLPDATASTWVRIATTLADARRHKADRSRLKEPRE